MSRPGRADAEPDPAHPAVRVFIDAVFTAAKEGSPVTPTAELRKQISLFLPVSEWLAIRYEAARRKIPMTELCREWLSPKLEQLRQRQSPPI